MGIDEWWNYPTLKLHRRELWKIMAYCILYLKLHMKISRCNCINLPACFFEPNILISLTHDDIIKMETFSALLAICVGNSPVPGEFPTQRPVTRSSDVFFDLRLNKRLSKQLWGWWFEMLLCSLWRHCNAFLQNTHNNYPVPMFISRIGTYLKNNNIGISDSSITCGPTLYWQCQKLG